MFDLNKTPTLVEGAVNQDSGTEKKPQMQANLATSAAPQTLASSSRDYAFDLSDLAGLLLMVQDPPNDLPNPPNLMFNSNHARLPSHTSAFSEVPATVGGSSRSAEPKPLAMVTAAPGDGAPAVPDVIVPPLQFKYGRVAEVWSSKGAGGGLCGNENQASQCQTTMDTYCYVVSDGESDSCRPRNSLDNSNSKAVLVDLDTFPHENPVELLFPWSPVHQGEPPIHSTLLQMSSENLQVSAPKLPKEIEEEHRRLREVEFHATFKLETQRCTPTARCRSCLAFCQARLPKLRSPSLQEGCGPGEGLQLGEECPPVLKSVVDNQGGQVRKQSRHGPKSKSSEYRGVTFYKRTGRHDGAQVYLGASGTKEEAARAYDQAALMLYGPHVTDINFKPESYQMEMAYLYKLTKEQLVIYLRRDSRGFGGQVPYPGVRHVKNLYQAIYETRLLGTFATEEDAARAMYKEAVRDSQGEMAGSILDIHHVRNMPSYAAQRFAALYPEAEGTQLRNQVKAIPSKRPRLPRRQSYLTSSPKNKKRSIRQARITAPPQPGALEKLPGNEINENIEVSPGAPTPTSSWGADLAPKNLLPRNLLPKFVPAPATSAASSSCHEPSDPSIPRATGEASSSGVIKFKLFNVEISAAVEAGYGGDMTEACGESEPQLRNQLILPPRKKRKVTGAAAPATPNPKPKKL